MKTRLPVVAEVEGLGRIVQADGDFYKSLKLLAQEGAKPISLRDEAYARLMTQGKEDVGITYGTGTFTSAGFEHARGQLPILRLESRLNNPELARLVVEANRQGNYFYTDSTREYKNSLRQAQKDSSKKPKERNVILLPSKDPFVISDKENWKIYEAIFKDQAIDYFELNGPIPIEPVNKDFVDSYDGTLLTLMWFRNLDDRSELDGNFRPLYGGGRLRGVLKSGEADALKTQGGSK